MSCVVSLIASPLLVPLALGTRSTYVVKQWDELCTLSDHKKAVTGVHWGTDAKSLISCGNDNMLRVFA
jgi:WD40 repeat protein